MPNDPNSAAVETVLRSWLDDPELTLFCGDWQHGGIMEMMPQGQASLTGRHYEAPFDGLRDLRMEGSGHHVHLDVGRLTRARYRVAPSVCYGFRPSFELRFCGSGAGFGLGLALSAPYAGRSLRAHVVRRYLRRVDEHVKTFPNVASFACDTHRIDEETLPVWVEIASLLSEFEGLASASLPGLRASLELASTSSTKVLTS